MERGWLLFFVSGLIGLGVVKYGADHVGVGDILLKVFMGTMTIFLPGFFSSIYSAIYAYAFSILFLGCRGLWYFSEMSVASDGVSFMDFFGRVFSPPPDIEASMWWIGLAHCVLYVLYGLRLSVFHFSRGFTQSYKKYVPRYAEYCVRGEVTIAKCTMISVLIAGLTAWLYLPLHFTLLNLEAHQRGDFSFLTNRASGSCVQGIKYVQIFGILLSLFGLVLEQIADYQKLKCKEKALEGKTRNTSKDKPVMTGLYTYTQNPNYMAEILVQIGFLLVSIAGFGWNYKIWLLGATPHLLMLLFMVEAIANMQNIHTKKYAHDPHFREYQNETPLFSWDIKLMLKHLFFP